MKKFIIVLVLLAPVLSIRAQILKPVKWDFTARKVKEDIYELHLTALVSQDWSIYSQNTPPDGPLPTKIAFYKNSLVLLGGKAKEIGIMKKKHDEALDVGVFYYQHKVDFVQVVQVKNKAKTSISGNIEFMTCDAHQCITDKVGFNVHLK